MTPERYWPRQAEVDQCIKAQAEAAAEEVLLAVHQPMPLVVRNAGSHIERPVAEHDVLEAFLTQDIPEGALLLSVTGASGAGKSHLIRWLAAQLQRDPRAERMLIVRIPKSASLRSVVELILEPLAKDPKFAKARKELQQAIIEVTPEIGAIRLAGGLEIALRDLADRLLADVRSDPGAPDAREKKTKISHAQRLSAVFQDAALEAHFKTNVLARIVERAIRGNDQALDDGPLPQFTAEDLHLPEGVELANASLSVRTYYQTVLARDGSKGFAEAADVLNEVLDPAIREVFRLGQAMGGMTLEEIILQIRDMLFQDEGWELVLLVEDFAALSGIQEILLRVCIQEAVRDGKLVRAPMRTALAVTDGYLTSRDTILTRAKREWIVKTVLDDDEAVIARTKALVASYLDAARWGPVELTRRFARIQNPVGDLSGWSEPFRDEMLSSDSASLLEAFGTGPRGIPLFPYNDAAIRSLAQVHLMEGGRLQFKPRSIINFILRDLLLRRSEFERGSFPPPCYEGARPNADVAAWLARAIPAEETRSRYASLLVHWGGNPARATEIGAVPDGIFRAFGLPLPKDLGAVSLPPPPPPPPGRKNSGMGKTLENNPVQVTEPAREDREITRWRTMLEAWSGGERMGQKDAALLRDTIGHLVTRAMNWNALRLSRAAIAWPPQIEIPHAAGNDRGARLRVAIAQDHRDPDGTLRRTLLAFARFAHSGRKFGYAEADEDGVLIANLVDRLADQLSRIIATETRAEVASLCDTLVRQARVIGVPTQDLTHARGLAQAILAPGEQREWVTFRENSAEDRWQALQKEVYQQRPSLQKLLVERLGCFQGTGNTPWALDVVKLTGAYGTTATAPREALQEPLRSHVTSLSDVRLQIRVKAVLQGLRNFAGAMEEALGNQFDKEVYLREAKELLATLEQVSVWPGSQFTKANVLAALEAFRTAAIMDVLNAVARLGSPETTPPLQDSLAMVSRVDLTVVDRVQRFIELMNQFLAGVEQLIVLKERASAGVDPEAKATELELLLSTTAARLTQLTPTEKADA